MNRSNIGNIATNAMQILSVGHTTAGALKRRLGHAEEALLNDNSSVMSDQNQVKASQQSTPTQEVKQEEVIDRKPLSSKKSAIDMIDFFKDSPQAKYLRGFVVQNVEYITNRYDEEGLERKEFIERSGK